MQRLCTEAFCLPGLRPAERLALMVLSDWTDNLGQCLATHLDVASAIELTPTSAKRVLSELEKKGHVRIIERKTARGEMLPSNYQVTIWPW